MRTLLILLTVCLQTAFAAEPLNSMRVHDLSQRSESVVRGHVLHQRMEFDQNGVWTVAMVRVTETLQGPVQPIREVRVPGGRLEDLEVMVARAPKLIPGDDVLLFLKGDQIVGLGEGAFVIDQERVWRALDAWTFVRPTLQTTAEGPDASVELAKVRNQLSGDHASSDHPSSVAN